MTGEIAIWIDDSFYPHISLGCKTLVGHQNFKLIWQSLLKPPPNFFTLIDKCVNAQGGGVIWMFIVLVPKVLKQHFLIHWLLELLFVCSLSWMSYYYSTTNCNLQQGWLILCIIIWDVHINLSALVLSYYRGALQQIISKRLKTSPTPSSAATLSHQILIQPQPEIVTLSCS